MRKYILLVLVIGIIGSSLSAEVQSDYTTTTNPSSSLFMSLFATGVDNYKSTIASFVSNNVGSLPKSVITDNYTWYFSNVGNVTANLDFGLNTGLTDERGLAYIVSTTGTAATAVFISHNVVNAGSRTVRLQSSGTTNADIGIDIVMGDNKASAINVVTGKSVFQDVTLVSNTLTANQVTVVSSVYFSPATATPNAVTGNTYYSTTANKLFTYNSAGWQSHW